VLVRGPLSPDTETLVRVHEPVSVMDLLDAASTTHSWTIPRRCGHCGGSRRARVATESARTPAARDRRCAGGVVEGRPSQLRIGAQILRDLNVRRMRLMAKARKMPSMAGFDLEVTGYVEPPLLRKAS
jgi:3,4-dihydroxy 2-butanone 4-phosphate synthase/GTP cyclohydrolase II